MSGRRGAWAPADPGRIRAFLDDLAGIGVDPGGGWSRLAFGPDERRAHELFGEAMSGLGARVHTDAVGNTIAVVAGREDLPAFVTGSHLDSVMHGGNYDGGVGVAAAIETARVLAARGGLRHPLTVVAFAAEEGARFGAPCIGSRLLTGAYDVEALRALTDRDGVSALERAAESGLHPESAASARWDFDRVACFIEVHIEQGKVLQEAGGLLGIVTVIGGSNRSRLTFRGIADHSGATPMRLRRDALAASSAFVLEVERRARLQSTAVATVGQLDMRPNSMTTVPGWVELAVDVRDIDAHVQTDLANALLAEARRIARSRGVEVEIVPLSDQAPVALDAGLQQLLSDAANTLSQPYVTVPSGASHDAGHLAPHTPTGMVFVPCRDGISHAPDEYADPADIARAVDLVVATLQSADAA